MFLFSARIPFVTVRPWTPNLGTLTFAMKKNPFYASQALPYNIYGGSTTFGAYDTIGNDFSKARPKLVPRLCTHRCSRFACAMMIANGPEPRGCR